MTIDIRVVISGHGRVERLGVVTHILIETALNWVTGSVIA